MLTQLPELITALPAELRSACERIFAVEVAHGQLLVPPEMEAWVTRHFGSVETVRNQTIVKVTNRLTLEGVLFNPVRGQRPSGPSGDDMALEQWIADELAGDIFAEPLTNTPEDVFGRIIGRYCVSASNVAKYDGWHGLIIFNEPHPLRFRREQVQDFLDVARRWIAAAHAHDPQAIYPVITWNCLPKSGATIVHGHMQIALSRSMPYVRSETWRRAALAYRAATQRSYCDDLYALHQALGLAITAPGAVRAFAHLTPLRAKEIVLLSDTAGEALAGALFNILQNLIERQGVRAFNVGIALPPLAATPEDWSELPVITRIADRGNALTSRNDLGAMELYATGVVSEDPFVIASLF